ncbi:LOW QUALITY PROTEIN: rhophilin-2-B [Homalodisca vitripennis]|uniref:LOW QUALITY PROTEIN: rhophilin-2-B n=1 Tax=Homalodisca vitripennis TaxID=197043 RepID=UPI001EEBCE10|nr:LOW QUALITY PROTEIN: rhophilin-2-B [Homalodisca vitripennis]
MSFPMSNGRFSDSDIDDFSSDSESDLSVNCNYDRPIVAGELQTFALNAALVTDITSPNDEAKEYVEGVAQEWFQDEDSDSGSDDWTSYQRDIGLNKTEQAELKSGSEGKTVPDSSSTREQLEYKFNPLNDTSTEIHNETDPTQENSDLKINHKIKKIAPKKPVDVDKSNEKNEEKSPQLNRQFNSVSPKKRAINQNIVIENKSLALSLDGQLDRNLTTICQQKEDDDEGISSDNDSKKSDQFNHQPKGTVLTRKDTYLKREFRPKSEACLNTLTQAIKDNNLYTSNLSLNSVSLSVQSFMSEGKVSREKQNSVDSDEGRDEIKNLDKKPNFAFIRGSDPRVATCRGKLQNKRSKLNQEINKELRLRAGAENLFKATTNRKLKETVALELSFVNSNLQLLKEQLAELNSSVELYQGDSPEPVMPMIPLGLKETKEIDFREPFKDFILEHYSEDGANYEDAIAELMDMRQAMRTPHRDGSGVALLFQYYNQLYFVERRFFPPDRSLGIYFEWYDSLTGVPSCQRTVAFEKACVLFNIAALYTQLGAKQDRLTAKGLDQAVDNFLRAAGTFTYVHENFTNAPSMDLAPHMLDMLVQLMLAQARECLFEKLELQSRDKRDVDISLDLAQEAAQVSEVYCSVQTLISVSAVRDYVPYSWLSLVQVKREHYAALAHHHSAEGLLARDLDSLSARTKQALQLLHRDTDPRTQLDISEPHDDHERKLLGRAHLRAALMLHEEAERLLRMCRELRNKQALTQVLSRSREATLTMYNSHAEKIDDFSDILDPPHIHASTKFQLSLTPPDFAQLRVEDLFKGLGPVAIFSAKHHWTAPRSVQLHRGDGDVGFGFSVRGDSPVIIAGVDHGSLAHFGGMKEGDFIVSIGDKDVKWAVHEEVVRLIKDAGDSLSLKLVTPMDRNYLKQPSSSSQSSTHSKSSSSSQPSPSNTASSHKKLTWNPFRRQRERETSFNLILR